MLLCSFRNITNHITTVQYCIFSNFAHHITRSSSYSNNSRRLAVFGFLLQTQHNEKQLYSLFLSIYLLYYFFCIIIYTTTFTK